MTMLDAQAIQELRAAVQQRTIEDMHILDEMREEIRSIRGSVRTIKPRSTTSVSLVASDGGNNSLEFDPFSFELVRVVDSHGSQLCFDVVSPATDTDALSQAQFDSAGRPVTALGRMMLGLGISSRRLSDLSPMIPRAAGPSSWVSVYRDLNEWAVLWDLIVNNPFPTDTLVIRDGLLRSKVFTRNLFMKMADQLKAAIDEIWQKSRRRVYLVGIAKHSSVLTRYHLAMAVERLMAPGDPRYVEIPRSIEEKSYAWKEWARGRDDTPAGSAGAGEEPKFVAGRLFLVRFGARTGDPVWAIDLFQPQAKAADEVMGYLLGDAVCGFPVPLYPRCLQKAHEYAQVVDFDQEILQEEIFRAVRNRLKGSGQAAIDEFRLRQDVAGRRYAK